MQQFCTDSDDLILTSSKNFQELAKKPVVFALDFTQGMTKPFKEQNLDHFEIDKSMSYPGKNYSPLSLIV